MNEKIISCTSESSFVSLVSALNFSQLFCLFYFFILEIYSYSEQKQRHINSLIVALPITQSTY